MRVGIQLNTAHTLSRTCDILQICDTNVVGLVDLQMMSCKKYFRGFLTWDRSFERSSDSAQWSRRASPRLILSYKTCPLTQLFKRRWGVVQKSIGPVQFVWTTLVQAMSSGYFLASIAF